MAPDERQYEAHVIICDGFLPRVFTEDLTEPLIQISVPVYKKDEIEERVELHNEETDKPRV